jgi:hypothetical protein
MCILSLKCPTFKHWFLVGHFISSIVFEWFAQNIRKLDKIQSPNEYRTSPVFRWLICVLKSNGLVFKCHLNTRQTCRVFEWSISLCTYCGLKTGPVFKWLKTRWLILPSENRIPGSSQNGPFKYQTCPVFGSSLYLKSTLFCLVFRSMIAIQLPEVNLPGNG